MLTHRSLITALLNAIIAYDVQCEDRSLMCFPMCHVSGYLITQHHMVGASVVLMRAYEPGAGSTSSTSTRSPPADWRRR